jgi:hypothetical protein
MSYAILARLRTCGVVVACVGAVSLAAAGGASAATCTASSAEQLESCITTANANTEANTIVLSGGAYVPGPKALSLTNTHGLQTIEGPTALPEAEIQGTGIESEHPELFIIATGVSAKFKDVKIARAGGAAAGGIEDSGTLSVENSTLSGAGSALVVQPGGSANILNSTLSDGAAAGLVNEGSATLKNVTIALNKTGGTENTGTLSLTNTIIAKNGNPQCAGAAAATNDHNLSSDESCGAEKKNAEPLLGTLFNNLGGTALHSLQPGSPAIDAGDTPTCPTTDQRGQPRPDVAATACDIGADEWNATAPTLHLPAEIREVATALEGKTVTYSASATSAVARIQSFSCTPSSGALFPIGVTTVSCTAKDGHGNVANGSFKVVVTNKATPFLYTNGVQDSASKVEQAGYGQIKLASTQLPGGEIECVNLAFGDGNNEGTPLRGHGQVLTWTANGHIPEGTHTELASKCRGLGGSGWAVDETPLEAGKRGTKVSTPWNLVGICGEREEESTTLVQLGYPTGEEPAAHLCKTLVEEEAEMSAERTGHTHCFKEAEGAGKLEPEGCVNVTIVDPTASLEILYGGSLRPKWTNGAGNGLNASKWTWEGASSNILFCELSGCAAPGTTTGTVKTVGFAAQQLIQAK